MPEGQRASQAQPTNGNLMSDKMKTPRTDAAWHPDGHSELRTAAFARALETELAEAKRERDEAHKLFQDLSGACQLSVVTSETESRRLRWENNRLIKALDQIAIHDGPGYPQGTCTKIAIEALRGEEGGEP